MAKITIKLDEPVLNMAGLAEKVGEFELLGTTESGFLVVRRVGSQKLERWHPQWFGMKRFDYSNVGDLDTKLAVAVSTVERKLALMLDINPELKKHVQILLDQANEMMSHEPPKPEESELFFVRGKELVEWLSYFLVHGKLYESI